MKVIVTPNESHLRRLRELPPKVGFTPGPGKIPLSEATRELGQVHRRQVAANFATEGATGARGPWATLSPKYARRKINWVGNKPILQLTGDTRRRLTQFGHPDYIERFVQAGASGGTFLFGARSDVAVAHLHGQPRLVTTRVSLPKLFLGVAKRLPVRDMITKTSANLAEMRVALKAWYVKRVEQELRAGAALGGSR